MIPAPESGMLTKRLRTRLPTGEPAWRHFKMREIREACAWAFAGGVAVHDTGFPYTWRGYGKSITYDHTCHLFARGTPELIAAARRLGMNVRWIQKPGTADEHFDLFGSRLTRALALCAAHTEKLEGTNA
jgi:hypothetical protein